MAIYYFDIETTSNKIFECEIVSVQYQDVENNGSLVIMTRKDYSEKQLIYHAIEKLFGPLWNFIPMGDNITSFDYLIILNRANQLIRLSELINRPYIDLNSLLIIANGLKFKGRAIPPESNNAGRIIPELYAEGKWDEIEQYIRKEAEDTIRMFNSVREDLEAWKRGYLETKE